VDLVIVMGTSMKVAPVSEIPNYLPATVPQIYVSRDVSTAKDLLSRRGKLIGVQPVKHINFDINLLGDCDTVVAALCERAGWNLQHSMLPSNLRVDVTVDHDLEHTYAVVAKKESNSRS
jgi:NAD-dependent histone deacetylase SIR2